MGLTPLCRSSHRARKSLKTVSISTFLAGLIAVCVAPLLLLAIYLAVSYVQTLQTEREEDASLQARNVATIIDRQVSSQIAALQVLAAAPFLDDPPRLEEFYTQALAFPESLGGHVVLADLSMQMLFNTRTPFGASLPKLPRPQGHAAAPTVLKTGKPAVGDMFIGPIAKAPLVAVAVPVVRDGKTKFLLLSIIETSQFQQRLEEMLIPAGWSLTVFDGKDEVMARRSPAKPEDLPVGQAPLRRFVAKSRVSHWSVVLEIPGSVYQTPIVAAASALVAVILAATVVSVLGARLASRRLAASVSALVETPARQVAGPVIAEIDAVRQTLATTAEAREAAEAQLRESNQRFEITIQGAELGLWDCNVQTGEVIFSEQWARIIGYTRDEIEPTFKSWESRVHPDDIHQALEVWNSHLENRTDFFTCEHRLKTKSGEWKWILDRGKLVEQDAEGKPLRMAGITLDIDERKRTEENLRASEDRFRRAVIESPFPIILHAEDGQVLQISRSWSEITGYSHEEIPTIADWTERAYGERKEIVQADIERLYSLDRRIAEGDYTIRTKDGATRIWDFSSAPLGRLPDGRRLVISMAMDVTELKQAEEERQKFVMLAESSSEFIGMCDLDLQPLYVNPAGVRMVGLPDMAAACRVKVQDYFFLEDQPFITEEFFPRVMREGHGVVEIRLRHFQTGDPVWMSYYLFHLRDAGGTVVGWATVSRDITERKKAQEEIYKLNTQLEQRVLERTAQLEEANRDLESFSYSVSHDLRAPLRAISGFAEIIARRHRNSLNEEGQRYFDNIIEGSSQMSRLIDDLLRYSRLGRRAVRLQALDPLASLRRSIKTLAGRIAESGAEIGIPEEMPAVHGDQTLMEQIFTNLLENALMYRRSRGTPRIQVDAAVSDGYVVIEVSDDGIGISPEYHQKIFNMFQRLHSHDEYPGTGIGLAIVRKSVSLMDGGVWLQSDVGQGSRFFVRLAQARAPDEME
jgi:PAS domain S-box-containing protein